MKITISIIALLILSLTVQAEQFKINAAFNIVVDITGDNQSIVSIEPDRSSFAISPLEKYIEPLDDRQVFILKTDDFVDYKNNGPDSGFIKFIDLIKRRNIKASMGLVGGTLVDSSDEFNNVVHSIKNLDNFEFWNHGWTHNYGTWNPDGSFINAEFKNQTYDYQLDQLLKTQDIVRSKFGITMHTFAAPGNRYDHNTAIAIGDAPELNVWMYNWGIDAPDGVIGIKNRIEMEWKISGVRAPDFERFKQGYKDYKEYIVSQLHPAAYTDNDIMELEKIIDFLITKDVRFMLPNEYYLALQGVL